MYMCNKYNKLPKEPPNNSKKTVLYVWTSTIDIPVHCVFGMMIKNNLKSVTIFNSWYLPAIIDFDVTVQRTTRLI